MNYDDLYDEEYYTDYGRFGIDVPYQENEIVQGFYEHTFEYIILLTKPKSVLDVGCAVGFGVRLAREEYDLEAFGVDVSTYAIKHSVAPNYCFRHNIIHSLPFTHKFDLVVCIEVMEHILPEHEEAALDNLCATSSSYIYFSSTSSNLEDATHFNVHPAEYWVKQFKKRGFIKYDYLIDSPIDWAMLFMHKGLL